MATQNALLAVKPLERRRSQRFLHIVPLVIRGESNQRKPFWEDTFSISISAHGALIILATKVAIGQTLILMNPQNWDERDVCVARLGSFDGDRAHVGVEFTNPAPEFWPAGALSLRTRRS